MAATIVLSRTWGALLWVALAWDVANPIAVWVASGGHLTADRAFFASLNVAAAIGCCLALRMRRNMRPEPLNDEKEPPGPAQ